MRKKLMIAIPALLLVVAGVGGGVLWYVNGAAQAAVDRHIANLIEENAYQEIEYETLDVHPNGDITMTNLHIVQEPFEYTLNDIRLSNFDFNSEFPRTLDVAIRGLELADIDPASADPQLAALATLLDNMNMSGDIPLELDYRHTYDPDNAHQMEQNVRLYFPDSFTLDADNVTRGLPPSTYALMSEIDQQDPAQAQAQVMALLAEVEVPSLRLSLQDQGFLEGLLASAAANNGVSPADMRNLLVSQTRNAYLFLPQNAQDIGMTIGAEVAEFIEGGKTITVTLAPEYGGKLQQLQQEVMGAVFTGNFAQVIELLHLDVVTD